MALQPEFDEDHRYKFSSSRKIGGRSGGFAVGLGRFSAGLPILDAMRDQQAEVRSAPFEMSLLTIARVALSKERFIGRGQPNVDKFR